MPRLASDTRWTWIFATILILVVVVVIGFLSGITSALSSIDKALGSTDKTLVDVNKDADPLPDYVNTINGNLTAIDKALKPIPGQGVAILGSADLDQPFDGAGRRRADEHRFLAEGHLGLARQHRRRPWDHHELAAGHVGLPEGHDERPGDDPRNTAEHLRRAGQRLDAGHADQLRAQGDPFADQLRHRLRSRRSL